MSMQSYAFPAVSIIIPLYNAEEYIGECLDSLLAQTFQDFEVIVVDDCSTDNSPAIVEGYVPKFDGRLKLTRMKKNSGGCAVPRNVGLPFSCGEYIFFFDADDTVIPTALEGLYVSAKKFDADVVRCEKYYHVPQEFWNDAEYRKQLKPYSYLTYEKVFVKEPLIWKDNFEERVKFFCQRKLIWNAWSQLIRRDFIIENEIKFCNIFAEDMLFAIQELCSAKTYVVVPNVFYNYRIREDSITTAQLDLSKGFHRQFKAAKVGVKCLDEFLNDNKFFSRRFDLKCLLIETFAGEMLGYLLKVYTQVPAHTFDELLRKELGDENHTALTALAFNTVNTRRLQLTRTFRRIAVLENELKSDRAQLMTAQKRIAALEAELKNK